MSNPMFKPHQALLSALALAVITACSGTQSLGKGESTAAPPTAPVADIARPTKQYSAEEFVQTTRARGAEFSFDESEIYFSSDKSGVWNAYAVPVSGGAWRALTQSTGDNVYVAGAFPNDGRLLLSQDAGGNELDHLFVRELDGSLKDLTPGEKLKAIFSNFTQDGSRFIVMTNERDERFFDLYQYDAKTYARSLLYQNDSPQEPVALSDDLQWLVMNQTNTTNDTDLFLIHLPSKKSTKISEHQGEVTFAGQTFSTDSKWFYYTSNGDGEFAELKRLNLATMQHESVYRTDWDVVFCYFSHHGRYRVIGVNEDGLTKVQVTDTQSGAAVALPKLPAGEIRGVQISRSEKNLAFYLNGDRQPSDLYVLPFGGEAKQLTQNLNPKIDPADLVESSVVRFASFDGMTIPNILWKPHQASTTNKVPALVWVHGGPGGQTTRAHNDLVQYFANHGYVVLGINNRGSSGYGKTFFAADDGKHGREPLWDTIAAKQYLQSLDYVDDDKIGIIGGSYGGYMTLAALAFKPDEFAVGVDIFGVSNWLRTLESIPPYWESFRAALYKEIGDPKTQRDFLIETSPVFHADKIKKPLMVLQGANDPRVIKPESDDIVAAVKKSGVPVEYVVFADEGHGFSKKANQIEGNTKMLQFLDRYLKNAP